MSPGQARNTIRRSLRAILDPEPSAREIESLWEYFSSSCAYCGRALDRSLRGAHVDHLVSASERGSNAISNRVLSCAPCNGDEKGDMKWEEFLRKKVQNDATFEQRRTLIRRWTVEMPAGPEIDEALLQRAAVIAIRGFDEAVDMLRTARRTPAAVASRAQGVAGNRRGEIEPNAITRDACRSRIEGYLETTLFNRSGAIFEAQDAQTTVICSVSRVYEKSTRRSYWFGFQPRHRTALLGATRGYVAFGCGSEDALVLIPARDFLPLLNKMNVTQKGERKYWHVSIVEEGDDLVLRLEGESQRVNLTPYLMPQYS